MENLSIAVVIIVFILFLDKILLFLGYVIGSIFGLPIHILRILIKKTLNYDFLESMPSIYENDGLFPHGVLGGIVVLLTIFIWKIIENLPYFIAGAIILIILIFSGNLTIYFISRILKIKSNTNILLRAVTGNIILSVFIFVLSLIIYYIPSYIEFVEICKRIFVQC